MPKINKKDLSYLQAFSPKILREAKRILCKGFTADDIDRFLNNNKPVIVTKRKPSRRLPRGARRQILANTKFGRKRP